MRRMLVLATALAAALAWSCGGNGKKPGPLGSPVPTSSPAAANSPAAARSAAPATAAAQGSPQPGSDEVTGIVGSINASTRSIEIDRLSGANVTRITLGPATAIHTAGGGATTLAQIRPSDRIIARGSVSERGDALIATEITVQSVVPGAQPGG